MMIGQQELVNKFNSYTLETLPHTILLLGDRGCGKHLLVKVLEFDAKTLEIKNQEIEKEKNKNVEEL